MHRYRSRDSHETPDALNSYHNYNENKAIVYVLFSWLLFTYNGKASDPHGTYEVSPGTCSGRCRLRPDHYLPLIFRSPQTGH